MTMDGGAPQGAWQTILWREAGIQLQVPPTLSQISQFSDVHAHLAFGSSSSDPRAFEALDLYFSRPFKDGDTNQRWRAWLTWLASALQWQNLATNVPVACKMKRHYGYRGSFRYTAKTGAEVVGALVVMQVHDAHIVICLRCAASREVFLGEMTNALLGTLDCQVMPPIGQTIRCTANFMVMVFLTLALYWAIAVFAYGFTIWAGTFLFGFLGTGGALLCLPGLRASYARFRSVQDRRKAAEERDSVSVAEPEYRPFPTTTLSA